MLDKAYVMFQYLYTLIIGIFHDILNLKTFNRNDQLTSRKQDLFYRHIFCPIQDCWARPIFGKASTTLNIYPRKLVYSKYGSYNFEYESKTVSCINLGSYNYLGYGGFVESITPVVSRTLTCLGVSSTTTRGLSSTLLQQELEQTIAYFLDMPDSVIIGMGFATNSTVLPVIIDCDGDGSGVLVLSDSFNHSSIIEGVRSTKATVKTFKHNDMGNLDEILYANTVANDHNWKKVIIIVEGIYSMEGDFCNLPEIVKLKKRYNAYLYLDEAHSIGATGATGRGITEHFNVSTQDVDVMMGTFTKSFGSIGGYVASTKNVINCIRHLATSCIYANDVTFPAVQQTLSTLNELIKGSERPAMLKKNSNYFRNSLLLKGFKVIGDADSPIIPVLIEDYFKLTAFSRKCLEQNVAVVIVGYPATPLLESRARFCISSEHTSKQLDYALDVIDSIGNELKIKDHSWVNPSKYVPFTYTPILRTFQYSPLVDSTWDVYSFKHAMDSSEQLNNFASSSYLSLHTHKRVLYDAKTALYDYGCGTCGPRGFYGTLDLHMTLETEIALMLNTEKAILYSYGMVVSSSVIPAFAKTADFLVYDVSVNSMIMTGINLSKASKFSYKHNDMQSLEETIISCKQLNESEATIFVVTEGLFQDIGDICNLPEMIKLKNKYKFYLIMDDSHGFGTIGSAGTGTPSYFDIPHNEITFYIGSLEHTIASVGGFCAGNSENINYQVLNGTGYCFSASLPAYCTAAASSAINILNYEPYRRVEFLTILSSARSVIATLNALKCVTVHIGTSPRFCIYIKNEYGEVNLQTLCDIRRHVALICNSRIDVVHHNVGYKLPYIKLCITTSTNINMLKEVVRTMIEFITDNQI